MRRLLRRREPAQIIVLAAMVMVSMIGVLALVVDAGLLWEAQRELQQTADSAALAGIGQLPDCPTARPGCATDAQTIATAFATNNSGVASQLCQLSGGSSATQNVTPGQSSYDVPAVPEDNEASDGTIYTLTVSEQCTAGLMFGRVLGTTYFTACAPSCLRANATAALGSLQMPESCPAPLAIPASDLSLANGSFGQLVERSVDHRAATTDNLEFHALRLANITGLTYAAARSGYRDNVAATSACTNVVQNPGQVNTEPFDITNGIDLLDPNGPMESGLVLRGLVPCRGAGQPKACANNYPPPGHITLDVACRDDPKDILSANGTFIGPSLCLATVPVVSQGDPTCDQPNQCQINVVGFGEFFILGWSSPQNLIVGMFVQRAPKLGVMGGFDAFGTIVTRLIR